MKECNGCHLEKDESEFYKRSGGRGILAECKECMKLRSKAHTPTDKKVSTVESERELIEHLNKLGVPTLPGKALGHVWADVICWGCVLLESKYSTLRGGGFSWSFSPEQYNNGLRADIIVLTCNWGEQTTYHAFDAFDPIFYNLDTGFMKQGVSYTPRRSGGAGRESSLTDAIMINAADVFQNMIQDKRLQVEENLRNGIDWLKTARNRVRL